MISEVATSTPTFPELWPAAEKLFHEALDRPTGERRSFLEQACGGDEKLLAEVTSLLSAFKGPEVFSEQAAVNLASQLPDPSSSNADPKAFPERLGPYRLLKVLGEGGMSTVYLAEQSEPLPRLVALKLMRWGGAHGEALRRFELEREALARMSHPTIAQVFGAGATEHGQPYVVIEHVPGPPITAYCDKRRLSVEERLKLFVAVCHGVRHAHEKAVIHRDLKPSNILVAEVQGEAVPKIIDFGIAKSLEPWSDSAAQNTLSQLRVGSPGYMSPEAIIDGGRGVDTRSDVYSLGIVLCQLLIGVRPFETSNFFPVLSEGGVSDPLRSSRRYAALGEDERRKIARGRQTSESRLLRCLESDLDWIVARAIAFDPAERYGSVLELATDVEGWLAGLPVAARPPSFFYRARKAVRRHGAAFLAVGLIAATLVGFSIRSNHLYQRAETARVQAEELVNFMLDDLSSQLEPIGHLDLLESVARRSLAYFESERGGDLEAAGRRPAAALRQIGRVFASRGDLDAALQAYDRARTIDLRLLRLNPEDPLPRLDLAQDLELIGGVYQAQGNLAGATAESIEAERLLRELHAEFPNHSATQVALAKTLNRAAALRRAGGQTGESMALTEEAFNLLHGLYRTYPDNVEIRHALGELHYGSGMFALNWLDDAEAAADQFEVGAKIFRELAASHPEASLWRHRLAVVQGQGLVSAYRRLHRLDEARAANREALELLEVLVRDQPGNSRWAFGLGWELIREGRLAEQAGDLEVAVQALERSVEVQRALLGRSTGQPNISWLDGLASALGDLAGVESRLGELTGALRAAQAALEIRRQMVEISDDLAFDHTSLASASVLVGELCWEVKDSAGALQALEEAQAVLDRMDGMDVEEPAVLEKLTVTRQRLRELRQDLGQGLATSKSS